MVAHTIAIGDEVVVAGKPGQPMKVVAIKGDLVACEWDEPKSAPTLGDETPFSRFTATFPREMLFKTPTRSQLHAAIDKAESLRAAHNGIGGVYLFMGHDGHNQCDLKDISARPIGTGQSGRSLLEAIDRAEIDWRRRKLSLLEAVERAEIDWRRRKFEDQWKRFWNKRSVVDVAAVAAARFGSGGPLLFNTANFLGAIKESDPELPVTTNQVIAVLAAHPRIARLKGGAMWCVLPFNRHE